MYFLKNLFSKKVECPRCLGKGKVTADDIQRLNMQLKWLPGSCVYCNGKGKVSKAKIRKVPIDLLYLTNDLSCDLKFKALICGDHKTIEYLNTLNKVYDDFIAEVEHMYFDEKLTPEQIVEFYSFSSTKKENEDDFLGFIQLIINARMEKDTKKACDNNSKNSAV